ncbi:ABC transporter ATP-binding protein [Olegusella massiliensis]|uniref:ABC transporter ATP-binding protein n=1 Tax=Olegusella massiliensis TaxID=1776381 RepID=UPI0003AE31AA|nr:ABC transporter ATP-binding protein [Olegusella massiliensis]ERL11705.1 ABC transporter, ATP-binding protein [Coriobacteriaceae bacterium BV3Ac1]
MAEKAARNAATQQQNKSIALMFKYAGKYRFLTYLGVLCSVLAMVLGFVPYICIWLVARDLIAVAPNWAKATQLAHYGWIACASAIAGILLYFAALMCTHVAAFRTASNLRKASAQHLMQVPLGYFDTHASGEIRRIIDGSVGLTEAFLAHQLPDVGGTAALFIGMLILLFVFDWRMGLACLLDAVISIACVSMMMAGKGMNYINEYQSALDRMNKAATEYVRGIPVIKVFQQTIYSFKAFHEAIEAYSDIAQSYANNFCRVPQALNLTFIDGIVALLVPAALILAPGAKDLPHFLADFAFYAIFSAVVSTALQRLMFAANFTMQANNAMERISAVLEAPVLRDAAVIEHPSGSSISFEHVSFRYENSKIDALNDLSFAIPAGSTVALVGPSGGGKTTAASLVPRFWDVSAGRVLVGGVDVRNIAQSDLMNQVAFVFQNNRLFKGSILDNVRAARPEASREEALDALRAAQCDDILLKMPNGADELIGPGGTYLSGGEVQRIALARAILKNSPIVVLDEATAFADPENEALIQKALARLTEGRTVLMVAHRLTTVRNADQIVVLDGGKLVESGNHDDLLAANGRYAHMWADYQQSINWKIRSTGKEA